MRSDSALQTASGHRIMFSAHALERFRERVRPALSPRDAESDLRRLAGLGEVVDGAPAWLADNQQQHAVCYLVVGDVVFPLGPAREDATMLCARTCIARGGLSDLARERRNAHRERVVRTGRARRRQSAYERLTASARAEWWLDAA
jgi:hypothetical protein